MSPKTKVKVKGESLADKLNEVPTASEEIETAKLSDEELKEKNRANSDALFDKWDEIPFEPQDFMINVPIDSLESCVGYSSLIRQFHRTFTRSVAYYRSKEGGSLPIEEARARSFHACNNLEEAKKEFDMLMGLPLECLNFVDLAELFSFAPRVAERFWEHAKREGRNEFESGHLAANVTFPVGYMKGLWNIARYLGVRESFLDDWNPKGGIEIALVDMLAQTYFQWQYWIEQTVLRSETQPREEHHEYRKWKQWNEKTKNAKSWQDGYWFPPYVSEQRALEQAVQMADRFNRIFMRTLRQLRDLRRYSPVIINNPNQVNVAADGGQQVNVSNIDEEKTKKIIS
jgi:hypothetical protein